MSTSTGAFGLVADPRQNSSRRVFPQHFLGGSAVAGLVLGCAWTVYANVFGASIYPSVNSAALDAPVVMRQATSAVRRAPPIVNNVFADLAEPPPAISAPQTVPASIMFNERFAAASPQGEAPRPVEATKLAEPSSQPEAPKAAPVSKSDSPKIAETPKPKEIPPQAARTQVALNVAAPPPRAAEAPPAKSPAASVRDMAQRAKAAVMSIASGEKQNMVEKLWGKQPSHGSLLAYASADASATGSLPEGTGRVQNPMLGGQAPYDRQTAVYDISARAVYLPDGTKLEAHSGLGSKLDDPRSSHIRMHGVTPPHIYELKPREALFHGVPALRLNPIGGEEAIFGRSGLLAHTYMLGPNGDSNGCVSFKDYDAFLRAYRNGDIRRLAVVARVE